MTAVPARRSALALSAVALGAGLALAVPSAASAHVHVTADHVAAGVSTPLTFSFSHGCDGAATTALVFDLPDLDGVTPVVDGAWTISQEKGADGIAERVVYTAASPVEDGLAASVQMNVIFGSDAAGTDVAFPVTQECTTGEIAWSELAEDGQDPHDLESPAPLVSVGEAAAGDEGHGHSTADAHDAEGAAASEATDAGTTATWLAGGALVVSLAALVTALLRRRA